MRNAIRSVCATFLCVSLMAAHHAAGAQQKPEPAPKPEAPAQKPAPPPAAPSIPVRVQLVLSKFKGDKKLTSLPFSLALATQQRGRLHVGARVPYTTTSSGTSKSAGSAAGDKPVQPGGASYNYNQIGTTLDCFVTQIDQGRFRVDVSVSDESVATPEDASYRPQGVPAFRTFSISGNSVVLRDGETAQLTTAADPVSGELMRVDVTLSLVK